MNRILFSLLVLLPVIGNTQTQDFGKPVSWSLDLKPTARGMVLPAINNELESNTELNRRKVAVDKRYVFGKESKVNSNIINLAEKTLLQNGDMLYRYEVVSKGAKSLNVVFSSFELAQGARLYVYDAAKTEFIGAHTFINNNVHKVLGIDLIHSDKIVIELIEPADKIGSSSLVLGTVIHGFRVLEEDLKSLNDSGDCMYDVNCPIGSSWKQQRNSVGILIDGGAFCSGSLVNNTSGVIIPYFLTANHCLGGGSPNAWVFRFRYESPEGQADCATSSPSVDGPKTNNINGCELKSNNDASDFCLLRLNNTPNPNWGVFYSGWDRSGAIPLSGTGVHHPSGDVMKISFEYQPLISTTYGSAPANSHWGVTGWDAGVTEGGSSGSPIFDQNHRVVGQLHGGSSACGNGPTELSDEYGKFSVSWVGGGTASTRLSDWLDPNSIGSTVIDGVDPSVPGYNLDAAVGSVGGANGVICASQVTPTFTLINNGSTVISKATIKYGYDGALNQLYNWTGSLVKNASALITFPVSTQTSGIHTFSVEVMNVNDVADQNPANNKISSSFTIIAQPRLIDLNLYTDCYGYETTWKLIKVSNNQVIKSGGPYAQSASSLLIKDSFCLTSGCYKFEIYDDFGDGFAGDVSCSAKGSYKITDEQGTELAGLTQAQGDFKSINTQNFCLSGVGLDEDVLKSAWDLYPNPTVDEVNIRMNLEGSKSVTIIDPMGKIVYDLQSDGVTQKIQTTSFSKGIYIVQLKVNGLTSFKRLVVQ